MQLRKGETVMNKLVQIDDKTRVVLKFHIPAVFTYAFCLQRKGRHRWRTVAWTYPSTHKGGSMDNVKNLLFYKEAKYSKPKTNERSIGEELMSQPLKIEQ